MYIIYISEQWIVKVAQLCPTLCDPMDCAVPGILQARILEWVAFPFSRGSSQPRDRIQVSRMAGRFFTSWATREAQEYWSGWPIPSPGDLPYPGRRGVTTKIIPSKKLIYIKHFEQCVEWHIKCCSPKFIKYKWMCTVKSTLFHLPPRKHNMLQF